MRDGAKIKLARRFRKQMTHAEVLLWMGLKGRGREGFTFRKQHPVGKFITDFYCEKALLAIEVDGQIHERGDNPQRDAERDLWFTEQGIEVMRIPAADIMAGVQEVTDGILRYVRERLKGL